MKHDCKKPLTSYESSYRFDKMVSKRVEGEHGGVESSASRAGVYSNSWQIAAPAG